MNESTNKKLLRREAEGIRRELAAAQPGAGARIARNFLANVPLAPGSAIAGYVALRGEADPAPLMGRLRASGYAVALPRVAGRNRPLAFHLWPHEAKPAAGPYGVLEAAPDWPAVRPHVLLVPLLAFDAEGYRLGYGGGYYDRTLRGLRASGSVLAVGIGFSGQEMVLPHDPTDEKLDWMVTEKDAARFER